MNLLDKIVDLLAVVPNGKWVGSHNGLRVTKVADFRAVLDPTGAVLFSVSFDETDSFHTLVARMKSAKGEVGKDEILFDNKEVEKDDVVISNRFVFPFSWRVVVEFKFTDAKGTPQRYRFDGAWS